jgi:hypothetical protein
MTPKADVQFDFLAPTGGALTVNLVEPNPPTTTSTVTGTNDAGRPTVVTTVVTGLPDVSANLRGSAVPVGQVTDTSAMLAVGTSNGTPMWGAQCPGISDIDEVTKVVGGRLPAAVGFYYSAMNNGQYRDLPMEWLTEIDRRGALPACTFQIQESGKGANQPNFSQDAVLAGAHTPYIRRQAGLFAAYGKPVLTRVGHEATGTSYPWAWGSGLGNTPEKAAAYFRMVVDIFREEGAENVLWHWCPDTYSALNTTTFPKAYPGDEHVDFVGNDGYNFALPEMGPHGWRDMSTIFDRSIDQWLKIAPSKPIILGEFGCATAPLPAGAKPDGLHGDKVKWLQMAADWCRSRPIRMVMSMVDTVHRSNGAVRDNRWYLTDGTGQAWAEKIADWETGYIDVTVGGLTVRKPLWRPTS